MAENRQALLVKLSPSDTGTRPLPSNTTFWTNTSIRLLHPTDGSIDDATSKEGVPTTIEVSVSNISSKPVSDVNVEAYVCNPTAGTASPANTVAGISGDGRFRGFRPGVLNAGATQPINCLVEATNAAWTPTLAQAGHHCVIANTWLDDGSEGAALGTVEVLQPLSNPHHGWRNINVVALVHDEPEMKFEFFIAAPQKQKAAELVLSMREARGTAALGVAERNVLRSGPYREIKPSLSRHKIRSFLFEGGDGKPAPDVKLNLKPGQRADLAFVAQFDNREHVGNLHTFDVITTDPNGVVQGGFRVLALFTK